MATRTTCDRKRCRLFIGRVSWPADLEPGNGPSASTYVCAEKEHQTDAARWVKDITGHSGVFVPFQRRT
ncbi:MAG: hypothetical protein ACRD0P_29120 [Stackebrandtia sp.]